MRFEHGAKSDLPKFPHPIMAWIPGIAVLVALLGVGVPVAIYLNTRVDSVKSDVSGLNTKLDKLNSAVMAPSNQQSDQTQKLIHDLLATAAIAKNLPTAAKAVEVASQLTATLRKEKRPASPAFFQSAIDNMSKNKQPSLSAYGL